MIFYSFFKSMIGKDIIVELKNEMCLHGVLGTVDQYLNIQLLDVTMNNPDKYPHMFGVRNCFIRGSCIRYVQLPADDIDVQILQEAAKKEVIRSG